MMDPDPGGPKTEDQDRNTESLNHLLQMYKNEF
jgi:hypothetical protein